MFLGGQAPVGSTSAAHLLPPQSLSVKSPAVREATPDERLPRSRMELACGHGLLCDLQGPVQNENVGFLQKSTERTGKAPRYRLPPLFCGLSDLSRFSYLLCNAVLS